MVFGCRETIEEASETIRISCEGTDGHGHFHGENRGKSEK
jgi:hypothetical protein